MTRRTRSGLVATAAIAGLWLAATGIHSLGAVTIHAEVVPAPEPATASCARLLTRQSEGMTLPANREACHDGHGKLWFRATVTTDGDARVHCDIRAFDAGGHQVFETFLPVELVSYPFGPTFRGGHPRTFIGFFVEAPVRHVDRYEASCGTVPGDAI
jgi:hypothetical protein